MTELDLRSNLKDILKERGMTQLELARQINITPTNLNTRLARGRNCQLSLLESICNCLNVDITQLMYGNHAQIHAAEGISIHVEKEETMWKNRYEEAQALQTQMVKQLMAKDAKISLLEEELKKADSLNQRVG